MAKLDLERLEELKKETHNTQMALYALAGERLGIEHEMIIRALLIEFRKGDKKWRIHKSLTPVNNSVASTIASYKTTCNKFLLKRGFPMPKQTSVKSVDEIIEFQQEHNIKDIVVKPRRGVGGYGVTILPQSKKEIEKAYQKAYDHCLSRKKVKVLVEEFLPGENFRLLVLDGKVIAAAHRIAAFVTGNDKDSIEDLVEKKNKDLEKAGRPLIKIDTETVLALKTQDLSLQSVPPKDQNIKLRFNANMSTGGSTRECLDQVHDKYKKLAVETTETIGLKLAGVDLITPDIEKPASKYGINEINHNPGLRIHYMPDEGKVSDVALDIQKYLLNNL